MPTWRRRSISATASKGGSGVENPLALAALALLLAACGVAEGTGAAATDLASTNEAAPARGCGRHGAVPTQAQAARPLPRLTGRVMDGANLLSPAAEEDLVRTLAALEAATTDQLVVVTVPSLDGEAIESLGLRLGNGWGIGRARINNGALLIVAPNERKVRIEVGCGLEGLLTDERAQEIIDADLLPQFHEERYEQGIRRGVAAIDATLRADPRRPKPWQGPQS